MAAEAEAAREARAKVIAAEGEFRASTALKEASLVIAQSPAALQLRYLQVFTDISLQTSIPMFPSNRIAVSNYHINTIGIVTFF